MLKRLLHLTMHPPTYQFRPGGVYDRRGCGGSSIIQHDYSLGAKVGVGVLVGQPHGFLVGVLVGAGVLVGSGVWVGSTITVGDGVGVLVGQLHGFLVGVAV